MSKIVELKTGRVYDESHYSQKEMERLVRTKRYSWDGEKVEVSPSVAVKVFEAEQNRLIKERDELETEKEKVKTEKEALAQERIDFTAEKKAFELEKQNPTGKKKPKEQ